MEIKPWHIVTLHEWAANPRTTYFATSESANMDKLSWILAIIIHSVYLIIR